MMTGCCRGTTRRSSWPRCRYAGGSSIQVQRPDLGPARVGRPGRVGGQLGDRGAGLGPLGRTLGALGVLVVPVLVVVLDVAVIVVVVAIVASASPRYTIVLRSGLQPSWNSLASALKQRSTVVLSDVSEAADASPRIAPRHAGVSHRAESPPRGRHHARGDPRGVGMNCPYACRHLPEPGERRVRIGLHRGDGHDPAELERRLGRNRLGEADDLGDSAAPAWGIASRPDLDQDTRSPPPVFRRLRQDGDHLTVGGCGRRRCRRRPRRPCWTGAGR